MDERMFGGMIVFLKARSTQTWPSLFLADQK